MQGIDETPCDILCPELGRTRSAYLYAQYGDVAHPYVCFAFASHKDEENVRRIVGKLRRLPPADACIVNELIAAASENRIIAVGCWGSRPSQIRAADRGGASSASCLDSRGRFKSCTTSRSRPDMTDDVRLALRQAESRPSERGSKACRCGGIKTSCPNRRFAPGSTTSCNRWEAFERFLEDGRVPIDNNRTEAMIKGPVYG